MEAAGHCSHVLPMRAKNLVHTCIINHPANCLAVIWSTTSTPLPPPSQANTFLLCIPWSTATKRLSQRWHHRLLGRSSESKLHGVTQPKQYELTGILHTTACRIKYFPNQFFPCAISDLPSPGVLRSAGWCYRRFGTRSNSPRRKLFLTHANGIYRMSWNASKF